MNNIINKIGIMLLIIPAFMVIQINSECVNGDCPFTQIDCEQCCSQGRFISDECARLCNCSNTSSYKADMSHAEQKDFPH